MFAAAIVVFIANRGFKTKRAEFSENMGILTNTTTEENIESEKQNETSSSIELDETQNTDSIYIEESESVLNDTRNIDYVDIGILSISGIFLIFTIIFLITFLITFVKHQQKSKKKMSK